MEPTPRKPSLRRRLKLTVWYAIDALVSLIPVARRRNRVLVVRLDRIGDLVLWLDAADGIAAFYREQGKEVVLLANALWAPWVEELNLFDRVIPLDLPRFESSLTHRFAAGLSIRCLGCDVAVSPAYSRSWGSGDAIVHLCGAAERIGSQGDPNSGTAIERRTADRWFTRLIPAAPEILTEIERNAEFVSGLTGTPYPARAANLRSLVTDLSIAGIAPDPTSQPPYYVLFPGASTPGKCWPIDRFQEIARRIHRETGWTGVICGGPADVELGRALRAGMHPPLIDRTGKSSLHQLTAMLAHGKLVVANDTAAVHIAAALSVPVVCVLGGGHVGRFLPYKPSVSPGALPPIAVDHPMDCFGCNWECIHPVPANQAKPCIAAVTVEDIWRNVREIIGSGKGR